MPTNPPDQSGVKITLEAQPAKLAPGGVMQIKLTITNTGGPVDVMFTSGQLYDFWIEKGDQVLWKWSEGRMFTQAIIKRTLKSGEVVTYTDRWDGKDRDGRPLAPGKYLLKGKWKARASAPIPEPQPVTIEISK